MSSRLKRLGSVEISGEKLFFIAYSISLVASFIISTTFMQYFQIRHLNWFNYLAIGILVVKIYIFDHYNLYQYSLITLLLLIGFLSWRKTNINSVMVLTTFILATQNVDFKKIIQHYFNINFTLILLTICYAILGIVKNLIFYRNDVMRLALGIDYPTDLAAYVFYLILAYVFLHFESLNWRHYLSLVIIALLINKLTNARLDVISIILIIPVIYVAKKAESTDIKGLRFLASYYWAFTLILPFLYFLLTAYYDPKNSIFKKLNKLLSGRLEYGKLGLDKYDYSIFGQRVLEHGWGGLKGFHMNKYDYFYIDSSFIRLIVIFGVAIGIFLMITIVAISIRSTLSGSYLIPAIILMVVISSLIDSHMLEITYNPFFLALLANITYKDGGLINESQILTE